MFVNELIQCLVYNRKILLPNQFVFQQSAINRKPGKEGLRLNGSLQKEPFSSVKTMSTSNAKEVNYTHLDCL